MKYLLPLSIIGIGVLLLLYNLDILHIRNIWHQLATWWPVIIILWGLHKLMEDIDRSKVSKRNDQPPPPSIGP